MFVCFTIILKADGSKSKEFTLFHCHRLQRATSKLNANNQVKLEQNDIERRLKLDEKKSLKSPS